MKHSASKYTRGSKVKVRGRSGTHVVSYPMVIPIPTIIKGEFSMVENTMYKFITKEITFYAWESECKSA